MGALVRAAKGTHKGCPYPVANFPHRGEMWVMIRSLGRRVGYPLAGDARLAVGFSPPRCVTDLPEPEEDLEGALHETLPSYLAPASTALILLSVERFAGSSPLFIHGHYSIRVEDDCQP
jgi:hypothetical protein